MVHTVIVNVSDGGIRKEALYECAETSNNMGTCAHCCQYVFVVHDISLCGGTRQDEEALRLDAAGVPFEERRPIVEKVGEKVFREAMAEQEAFERGQVSMDRV